MKVNLQPVLENEKIILYPLKESDFQQLYTAASDPEIWKQHPNPDRWKRPVLENFFTGAMKSGGAFKVVDKLKDRVIGSTRYYDYNAAAGSILIGYTFYAVEYWGKGVNPAVKSMMLDYIFQFVSTVQLHIGASNIRSQISIARLGAEKTGSQEVQYYGEAPKRNYVYQIRKEIWNNLAEIRGGVEGTKRVPGDPGA